MNNTVTVASLAELELAVRTHVGRARIQIGQFETLGDAQRLGDLMFTLVDEYRWSTPSIGAILSVANICLHMRSLETVVLPRLFLDLAHQAHLLDPRPGLVQLSRHVNQARARAQIDGFSLREEIESMPEIVDEIRADFDLALPTARETLQARLEEFRDWVAELLGQSFTFTADSGSDPEGGDNGGGDEYDGDDQDSDSDDGADDGADDSDGDDPDGNGGVVENPPKRRRGVLPARNLLRFAIYNISYIRGLFPEKYFNDKSVPALEMKIKKLMPMDAESRRLIDWMEKGVYDALQKKYLKTLLFCICEKEEGPMIEEYAFTFSYPSKGDEVAMNLSRTGIKKNSATFKSDTSEVTADQMRSSACKMIRTLISLMRTLDQMPDERTILLKLLYYDDVTPEDYEPPFFKSCADNEAINIWNKNPLKMEVGSVNSKHLVLALKVKSVLDPCEGNNVNSEDDNMSLAHESDQDDDFSDTEVRPSEVDRYVVAPYDGNRKVQSGSVSEEDTQDPAHEEDIAAQVREWICSTDINTVHASVVLSNFPDISMGMVEDILEKLLQDGLLSRASKDSYAVNKPEDYEPPFFKGCADNEAINIWNKNPLKMEVGNVNSKHLVLALKVKSVLDPCEANNVNSEDDNMSLSHESDQDDDFSDTEVRPSEVDRYVVAPNGKGVIHSEASNRKFLEIEKIMEVDLDEEKMGTDTNPGPAEFECGERPPMTDQEMVDGSTNDCVHSVGSDLTRSRERRETEQTTRSMQKDPSRTPTSMREPATSLETRVLGQRTRTEDTQQGNQTRKASLVKEPILQHVKRQKAAVQVQ